ncbi:hypothetical protein [Streptomyces sp. NPDC091371]|uniref:hypothetical protein n=1 Tax=Streptomyces sp. NPDC091371 TaxID=3155303 RepID=UPI003429D11C
MSTPRRSTAWRAALLLVTGALALTPSLPAGAAPTAQAAAKRATGAWEVPGDARGGNQVYDGYQDDNVSRFGLYAMIYHLPGAGSAKECQDLAAGWPKQTIDYFNPAPERVKQRSYLREQGEFIPTGETTTVPPKGSAEVTNSRTTSQSWQHSIEISGTATIKKVLEIGAKYGFTYTKTVETTKGETVTANNPSNTKTQEYAYGFTRDHYVVQQRAWEADWHKKGDQIFVGDTVDTPARFTNVKVGGCYRKAYFATVSAVRAKGLGLVAEYDAKNQAKSDCALNINSEQAAVFERSEQEPRSFDKVADIGKGTCFGLTGTRDSSTGSTYLQMKKADKVGGTCEVSPEVLCDKQLWVNINQIAGQEQAEPEPPQWKAGQRFVIRPVTKPDTWLGIDAKKNGKGKQNDIRPFAAGTPDSWELVKAGGGKFRLKSQGRCMSGTGDKVPSVPCGSSYSHDWDFIYAADTVNGLVFHLQEHGYGECATHTGTGKTLSGPACKTDNRNQRWRVTKAS